MSPADHYRLTHRMVSAQQYQYTEIIEMLPYERDVFITLLEEDVKRREAEEQKHA